MQKFSSKELANRVKVATLALEDAKAVNLNVLNLENKGLMAEAMLVVNGTSNVHMQAIANRLERNLRENKISHTSEGLSSDVWALIDCGDLVVHIFSQESRDYYGLEKLWENLEEINDAV